MVAVDANEAINLLQLWTAQWPTMLGIPSVFVAEWANIFADCLLRFSRDPTIENYASLVRSTKLILAAPVHGGKQRQHTTERLLRARLSKWHAGDIGTLWSDVKAAWDKSSGKRRVRAVRDFCCELPQDLQPAASRSVCQLAAVGALSKACKVLCSRGVASDTPETRDKLIRLFPTLAQPVTITTSQRGTYDPAEIRSVVERILD